MLYIVLPLKCCSVVLFCYFHVWLIALHQLTAQLLLWFMLLAFLSFSRSAWKDGSKSVELASSSIWYSYRIDRLAALNLVMSDVSLRFRFSR